MIDPERSRWARAHRPKCRLGKEDDEGDRYTDGRFHIPTPYLHRILCERGVKVLALLILTTGGADSSRKNGVSQFNYACMPTVTKGRSWPVRTLQKWRARRDSNPRLLPPEGKSVQKSRLQES